MNSENTIPEELVPAVLERASQLYQQPAGGAYSLKELMAAGSEVSIPPEVMQQAYEELQAEQHQKIVATGERKKAVKTGAAIAAACTFLAALWAGSVYNTLNAAQGTVDGKWAQVENQMQRRADLIPQLTNIAESYADREAAVIVSLNDSRQAFLSAGTVAERSAADEEMKDAIANFQTYAAGNTQLQSSELFVNLQYEIAGTENRLATERMRYNQSIEEYNRSVKSFPTVVFAGFFGFKPHQL